MSRASTGPAASFENPVHVSIVVYNHRWRLRLGEGESRYDQYELQCPP
jgi:hypothetical protein